VRGDGKDKDRTVSVVRSTYSVLNDGVNKIDQNHQITRPENLKPKPKLKPRPSYK